MNRTGVLRLAAGPLLLAGLVGINLFPFFTGIRTPVDTIFFALSAIHAELCLFLAWGIFVDKPHRFGRLIWCLLGGIAAFVAAVRLLPGRWLTVDLWLTLQVGLGMTLPALLPMACLFAIQRFISRTELVFETAAERTAARFRLRQLFVLTAGCAFLSLLIRQLVKSPDGWLAQPDAGSLALTVGQSFVMGLLAGPCGLVILKPKMWSLVWLLYFVAICAAEPLLGPLLVTWRSFYAWSWSVESYFNYFAVVLDNITWYGPQLLPTFVLFAALRLTGVQVRDRTANGASGGWKRWNPQSRISR